MFKKLASKKNYKRNREFFFKYLAIILSAISAISAISIIFAIFVISTISTISAISAKFC